MQEKRKNNSYLALENHIQTILVSLITAGILWSAVQLTANQSQLARFEEQIIALSEKIDGLIELRKDVQQLKIKVGILESKENLDG